MWNAAKRQKTEMNLPDIKALIDVMAASDLSEMEFKQGDMSVRLVRRKDPANEPATRQAAPVRARTGSGSDQLPNPNLTAHKSDVAAPLYGVVHWQPSPDAPPFVTPGQEIKTGQVVCVVEAMKVFNEVRVERDATVVALLVESGVEVEAGQRLLQLS